MLSVRIGFTCIWFSIIQQTSTSYEKIRKFAHTDGENTIKKMHVEESTQITHPFAEAECKTLLLFVNVKQKKYDTSSKQVETIGFSVFNISCFP
jgi:hypothetical protein